MTQKTDLYRAPEWTIGGQIVWTGDLEDDCVARWNGLVAHAECMSEYDPTDPDSGDSWYCSVWWEGERDYLFHDMEADLMPKTGPAARWLCETVMRLMWVQHPVGRRDGGHG